MIGEGEDGILIAVAILFDFRKMLLKRIIWRNSKSIYYNKTSILLYVVYFLSLINFLLFINITREISQMSSKNLIN